MIFCFTVNTFKNRNKDFLFVRSDPYQNKTDPKHCLKALNGTDFSALRAFK